VLHLLRRGQPRRLRPEVRTLVRLGLCYYLSCARARCGFTYQARRGLASCLLRTATKAGSSTLCLPAGAAPRSTILPASSGTSPSSACAASGTAVCHSHHSTLLLVLLLYLRRTLIAMYEC
jgi:hypothetical protein